MNFYFHFDVIITAPGHETRMEFYDGSSEGERSADKVIKGLRL